MVHPLQNAAAHIPRLLTSVQVGQNHSSTGTLARGGVRHSQWYLSHPNMPCKDTHPYIQHLSCTTTKKLTYQLHTLHLPHTTGKVSQQLQPNVNIQHLNIYKYSISFTFRKQKKQTNHYAWLFRWHKRWWLFNV